MRFSTIASIFASALSVTAQTSQGNTFGWSVELIQELTKLPSCAVCISAEYTALHSEVPTKLTFYSGQLLDSYITPVSM
jgi:hypothetical protein